MGISERREIRKTYIRRSRGDISEHNAAQRVNSDSSRFYQRRDML